VGGRRKGQLDISDLEYSLPEELIAQHPPPHRRDSRLMVISRKGEGGRVRIRHHRFYDIVSFIGPDDVLVLNDTRVVPALVAAKKETGGHVDILFIGEVSDGFLALVSGKNIQRGTKLILPGDVEGRVERIDRDGCFFAARLPLPLFDYLEKWGRTPLPPYIKRKGGTRGDGTSGYATEKLDRERYQTVYADRKGSVAAPTAGFHFDDEMVDTLGAQGTKILKITLHVGTGTFLPIRSRRVEEHVMHEERYIIDEATARAITEAKSRGSRVMAVGTTTVRALESAAESDGVISTGGGKTSLFIMPGFEFKITDALLTNFHLPRSTLLALVMAFLGREQTLSAYGEAIKERYRFYSYGDAMLIE
jgi:S-adenosylmethionine:tRNA ribosyltransferase-isomerase